MTYESKLYIDIRKKVISINNDTHEEKVERNDIEKKVALGTIPIMVKSDFCVLNGLTPSEL